MGEMNRNTDKRNEYLIFNRLCKQSCIAEILDCFVKVGSKKGGGGGLKHTPHTVIGIGDG